MPLARLHQPGPIPLLHPFLDALRRRHRQLGIFSVERDVEDLVPQDEGVENSVPTHSDEVVRCPQGVDVTWGTNLHCLKKGAWI